MKGFSGGFCRSSVPCALLIRRSPLFLASVSSICPGNRRRTGQRKTLRKSSLSQPMLCISQLLMFVGKIDLRRVPSERSRLPGVFRKRPTKYPHSTRAFVPAFGGTFLENWSRFGNDCGLAAGRSACSGRVFRPHRNSPADGGIRQILWRFNGSVSSVWGSGLPGAADFQGRCASS